EHLWENGDRCTGRVLPLSRFQSQRAPGGELVDALGVDAFVLTYRLGPRYHHPIELGDAQRAIRFVRSRAKEFGVLPNRVGIMGFSAGGHLASTAAIHFDNGTAAAPDPIDRVAVGQIL